MAKNYLFGHLGSQNGFRWYPPLTRHWSIDCNSLVFFNNQIINKKNCSKPPIRGYEGSTMVLKNWNFQNTTLGLLLNLHPTFKFSTSIWMEERGGINSKKKKNCQKTHFFWTLKGFNGSEKLKLSKYNSRTFTQSVSKTSTLYLNLEGRQGWYKLKK